MYAVLYLNTLHTPPRMRSILTMSLPVDVRKKIDAIAKREHLPRSQVVQLALNDFLFKYEFRRLRSRMIPRAQKQGIYTDEDVFDRVS